MYRRLRVACCSSFSVNLDISRSNKSLWTGLQSAQEAFFFPAQELGGSIHGECTNFQAVSGRGLHCVVSGVERYAAQEGESSETLTRHLYSSTEVSLVPSNIQDLVGTAHSKKKYQVSLTLSKVSLCLTFLTVWRGLPHALQVLQTS